MHVDFFVGLLISTQFLSVFGRFFDIFFLHFDEGKYSSWFFGFDRRQNFLLEIKLFFEFFCYSIFANKFSVFFSDASFLNFFLKYLKLVVVLFS